MRRTANKEGDQGNAIVANQLINGRCGRLVFPYICTKVVQGYIKKDYVSKVLVVGIYPSDLISECESFFSTRSCAALRTADLDWIVGPEYSLGGHTLGILNC